MRLATVLATACALASVSASVTCAATINSTAQLTPGYSTIDFESITAGTNFAAPASFTVDDVTFSTSSDLAVNNFWVVPFPDASGNYLTLAGAGFQHPIKISFSSPRSEVLVSWVDPSFAGNVIEAYDSGDNLLETAAVPTGAVPFTALIGFQRATADISYVLTIASQPDDLYYLDNIRHGVAVVPEPSSIALMGLGMAAIGGCAWRRRKV